MQNFRQHLETFSNLTIHKLHPFCQTQPLLSSSGMTLIYQKKTKLYNNKSGTVGMLHHHLNLIILEGTFCLCSISSNMHKFEYFLGHHHHLASFQKGTIFTHTFFFKLMMSRYNKFTRLFCILSHIQERVLSKEDLTWRTRLPVNPLRSDVMHTMCAKGLTTRQG